MNIWHNLALPIRVTIICISILVFSIFRRDDLYEYVIAFIFVFIIFYCIRAFRIGIYQILLFVMVSWAMLALILLSNSSPVWSGSGTLYGVPFILSVFLGSLLLTQSIKLEEWISFARSLPVDCSHLILAASTSWSSGKHHIRRALESKQLSRPWNWSGEKGSLLMSLDWIITHVIITVTLSSNLYDLIDHWKKTNREPDTKSSEEFLRLNDIYEIHLFPTIYDKVFGVYEIESGWKRALAEIVTPEMKIIDIGAGSGKASIFLSRIVRHVDAFEPNSEINRLLKYHIEKERIENISIISAQFPIITIKEKYDVVIMHQNVFLEILNEISLQEIWESIKKVLKPSGILFFDYPCDLKQPKLGEEYNLINQTINGMGTVKYSYTYHGMTNKKHIISSSLSFVDGVNRYNYKYPMEIFLPDEETISLSFQQNQFKINRVEKLNSFTFFPGTLKLFVLNQI